MKLKNEPCSKIEILYLQKLNNHKYYPLNIFFNELYYSSKLLKALKWYICIDSGLIILNIAAAF